MSNAALRVPRSDIETVKHLGARWDRAEDQWHVPDGRDPAPFTGSSDLSGVRSACSVLRSLPAQERRKGWTEPRRAESHYGRAFWAVWPFTSCARSGSSGARSSPTAEVDAHRRERSSPRFPGHLSAHNGEQLPGPWHALEFVLAALDKLDPRADDEVLDCRRHQHFAGLGY